MTDSIVLESAKSGLVEYINSLLNIYYSYLESPNNKIKISVATSVDVLDKLLTMVDSCQNIDSLFSIKKDVINLEQQVEDKLLEIKKSLLTSREIELVNKGYNIDDVLKLASFTEEQAEEAAKNIFARITNGCSRVSNPFCIYLGGQPGCGKTTTSMKIKSNADSNGVVEIGIDNYRTYHPNYLDIERVISNHWKNKKVTDNDSPGNDIADFTHNFAGRVTDILIDLASHKVNGEAYNIVMEYGMRTPEGPLSFMEKLKEIGYKNIVSFIAVHKDVSMEACRIRADIMNNQKHIVRRVPKSFHDLAVSTLPDSCETIYEEGFKNKHTVDDFTIITRDSKVIWNTNSNDLNPKQVYDEYLNNPKYSVDFSNNPDYAKLAYLSEALGFKNTEEENKDFGIKI